MGLDTKTYWLTDRQSQCNFDFDFDFDVQDSYELRVVVAAEAREQASKSVVGRRQPREVRSCRELEVGLWRLNEWLENFIHV
jgi:hypothetical protein